MSSFLINISVRWMARH